MKTAAFQRSPSVESSNANDNGYRRQKMSSSSRTRTSTSKKNSPASSSKSKTNTKTNIDQVHSINWHEVTPSSDVFRLLARKKLGPTVALPANTNSLLTAAFGVFGQKDLWFILLSLGRSGPYPKMKAHLINAAVEALINRTNSVTTPGSLNAKAGNAYASLAGSGSIVSTSPQKMSKEVRDGNKGLLIESGSTSTKGVGGLGLGWTKEETTRKDGKKDCKFVTPEKAKRTIRPSLDLSPVPTQSSRVSISVKHVIYYVTTWLQSVLGVKQLRNIGITNSIVEKESRRGATVLGTGKPEVRLEFESKKSDNTVVVVTLANILTIQKHNDLKCSRFVTFVNAIVKTTAANVEATPSRPATLHTKVVTSYVSGDATCFHLPFRSTDQSLLSADECLNELKVQLKRLNVSSGSISSRSFFENSLRDLIATKMVVNGNDVATLKPHQLLNDVIINTWLKWLTTPRSYNDTNSDVHVFSSYFISSVMVNGYNKSLRRWLKKVNVFEKKLLLFPIHAAYHWSLIAVISPKLIKQTSTRYGDPNYSRGVSCMIHLDSLGSSTMHDRHQHGWAIRGVLNVEWGRHYNDSLDKAAKPFTHRTFQLHCPSVPIQDNNYDCGVFLLRNAFNLVQKVDTKVLMTDVNNRLQSYIDNNELFHYDKVDIDRMRVELFTMYGCLTNVYQHRRVITQTARLDPLELESDSEEEDEDEVVMMSSYPDRSDTASNGDSDLSWRNDDGDDDLGRLDDEDSDHLLIADTTDDIEEFRAGLDFDQSTGSNEEPKSTNNSLNAYVQLGDVIEYRDSKKPLPSKGVVISIGALSSDKIIQVSDGTWLYRTVHQIRRVEIMREDHDRRLVNPNPLWKSLSKVFVIPPYEDADEDSDEEEDLDDAAPAMSEATRTSGPSREQSGVGADDCGGDDISESSEGEGPTPMFTARSEKDSKRQRTSCGETNNSVRNKRRRTRNKEADLNRRRMTEKYIWWADPGKDYNEAKEVVNSLYLESLSYGVVEKFYEKNLFNAPNNWREFRLQEKALRKFIDRRRDAHNVRLAINANVKFMDNPKHGVLGRSRETKRQRRNIEEIFKFEYKMRTLQLETCKVCLENKLVFSKKEAWSMDAEGEIGNVTCDNCRTNKCSETDYYLKMNLQPIWFERRADGDLRLDEEGNPVPRYDIPNELKSLTMAEKLLIRRCSPLIPSHHIKNGTYGIFGHCVAFPQNIDEMCMDLPQKESNMVIFIRQVSNRVTGVSHSQHFRVNKNKVLTALRWLKKHHRGYHDITITESNLDWIKEESVFNVAKKYTMNMRPSKRDAVADAEEAVSSNQCTTSRGEDQDVDIETVHPNYKDDKPNEEQSEIIKGFQKIAKDSNQSNKVLKFPPIDHTKPLNEYDSTEQVFVNAYPWLFPGGIGDVYDPIRGKVKDIYEWAKHLLRFHDGRFLQDQLFVLYVFNMLQRHLNNTQGNFFFKDKNFLGRNPPTVEELQEQIRLGDFSYINKLRYLAKGIRGSDSFWRGKTEELEAWIDFHISRGNGPPTHFATLSCAENWWPDLRRLMIKLERQRGDRDQVRLLEENDFAAMCKSARRFTVYVNDFFMKRSRVFLDTVVKNAMGIEHYWARVEFAPGRGQIHLHLLGIGKDKSYLNDFYKAKTEDEKAKVMETYATSVLDMTADVEVDEIHVTDTSSDSISPLKHRFGECYNRKEDVRMLCQECMVHQCNNYCLGDDGMCKPRECRFDYGKESEYGKCDTAGKPHTETSLIVMNKRGVEHFQLRRTKSRKAVQHSQLMLQSWRGNVDVQLLLYRSHPNKPDVSEIENVCKYVVAYASKKNHTSKKEKEAMQNIIQSASSADISGVSTLVKMSLNWMTSKRLISVQEAVHEVDRQSLTLCSEVISYVSLQSCLRLRKSSDPRPRDLVYTYANRPEVYIALSLEQYFYQVWCKENFLRDKDSDRPMKRILIARGLNCRPRHPIDFDYARGMLILHKPWSVNQPLNTRNKDKTIETFKKMLDNRTVPTSVQTEYMRAVRYSQEKRIEVVAKQGVLQGEVDMDELDQDDADQHLAWRAASQFTDGMAPPVLSNDRIVDIGLEHDWSERFYKGVRDIACRGEDYTTELREQCSKDNADGFAELSIPTRYDGSNYSIDDLSDEQLAIVLATIDTVVNFLTNDEEYKPLRATIIGMGGCGKSLIINTIISIIRELTDVNNSVLVAAPSGSAAYNVKGCTLHSLLSINVQVPWKSLDEKRKAALRKKLSNLLVLMIDERSMLNSQVTFAAEEHVRECAYNGHNYRERWGGAPVVLLFGDDYQLPPTDKNGVIDGFTKFECSNKPRAATARSKNQQICEYEGYRILAEMMTKEVFMLTKNFRTSDEEDSNLMNRMRVGNQTTEDAERLMNLHTFYYPKPFMKEIEDDPKTLWAYAKRDDMNKKNVDMLVKTQETRNVPIARLKCRFENNMASDAPAYPSHFYGKKILYDLDVCVGAQVCLETANIHPNSGLFIGAIGQVVDIVYDKSVGPNGNKQERLPRYIVVDFPSYKPPASVDVWDKNNPTHVPIPPYTHFCNKGCCTVTFMPLQLAYAITIHRCQGLEAGFDEGDRWRRVIIDPSDVLWEISKCLGTIYVSTSRGKTLGSKDVKHPTDSSIYWIGSNVSLERIHNCKRKKNNQLCDSFQKRKKWVTHLEKKAEQTREKYNQARMDELKNTTVAMALEGGLIRSKEDLTARIIDIVTNPNQAWKEAKKDYQLPQNYYDT